MFNLFKSKTVKGEYPQVVKDIHNQFNVAGDRLLKQAQDIISSIRVDNKDKIDSLKSVGFRQVKEVSETEAKIAERRKNENIANVISELKVKYPQYKFITNSEAVAICKKYGLVIGEVGLFKGFVPEKNLKQITEFLAMDNELVYSYTEENHYFGRSQPISLEEYERQQEKQRIERERDYERNTSASYTTDMRIYSIERGIRRHEDSFYKKQQQLYIAAPIKDMDTRNHKLDGVVLRKKEVPDPVVLCPYNKNGIELYCIVTAWGDEASDPIVVNETNN